MAGAQLSFHATSHVPTQLDALGKQRSLRISGSNDEVEQTLNQMLACMDGLETSNNGVVVMGATNRYGIAEPLAQLDCAGMPAMHGESIATALSAFVFPPV